MGFMHKFGLAAGEKLSALSALIDRVKEARKLHGKLLSDHARRHFKVLFVTMIAYALSSWLTTKGLFDKAIEASVASPEGMITAAMSAVVAAVLVGGATMMLFGVATGAFKAQFRQVLLLGVTLLPFILAISTYNAVLGIAGPPSLIYDMRQSAAAHARYFDDASGDAEQAQVAAAALEPQKNSICALAEGEGSSGTLTGSGGKGAVYAAFFSACKSLKTIVHTLLETVERNVQHHAQAALLIDELHAIPRQEDVHVFKRQAEFRDVANELVALADSSGAENLAERLVAQLSILESSVATLDVKAGSFGEKQSSAVAGLNQALVSTSEIITGLVGAGPTDANPKLAPPLLDMGAAIAAHWRLNISQIALAIAIDLMAVWFLGLLIVSKSTADRQREEYERLLRKQRRLEDSQSENEGYKP